MSETMKTGKDYVDFYKNGHTFYELSLVSVRPDNLEMQIEHMLQKRWFTPQMAVDFRKALERWVNRGNALHCENESDIVRDVAALLAQVGVHEIDEHALDVAIHQTIKAQDLINHAAGLFFNRNRQGLITFNQLLAIL